MTKPGPEKSTDKEAQREHAPMLRPRFTGIASFMRTPIAESLEGLDIALIGIPTDLGVTNRAGARHGPREIRNASSLMRSINISTGIEPYKLPSDYACEYRVDRTANM